MQRVDRVRRADTCSTDGVIDRDVKQCLGQMMKGVEVVGAQHNGVSRAYTSHWVTQVSFEEPVVMASVSPRHDTHPLMLASGEFSVSVLAGDQVAEGQYFSYPGRRFRHIATEYIAPGRPMLTAHRSFRIPLLTFAARSRIARPARTTNCSSLGWSRWCQVD